MPLSRVLPPPVCWSGRPGARDRRVTWVELFFDLVFVAAVSQVGAPLATHYSFDGLGRYAFLLLVVWWTWHGYALYANRFDSDDTPQRVMTFLQMIAVIFMAANAEQGLDSVSSAGFAAAYGLTRAILVVQYLRAAALPEARRLALEYAAGFGLAAACWLISAVAPLPARYAIWAVALAVDLGTAVAVARHTAMLPPDAAHLPERFGLFTLILLGESIVAIIKGIQSRADWSAAAAASAFLGIGLVMGFWWWYFEGAEAAAHRHVRSARDARGLEVWTYAHLLLYLGLALVGVGIEHIVRTGASAPLRAEEAWLLCGAASAAMVALTVLAATRSREPGPIKGRYTVARLALSLAPLALPVATAWLWPPLVLGALLALSAVNTALLVHARHP